MKKLKKKLKNVNYYVLIATENIIGMKNKM